MSSFTLQLTDTVYSYLLENAYPESDVAAALREDTHANLRMAVMQISPEQGAFMKFLVRLIGAKKAIEVGTFTGYSALCVAEVLPESGKLIACDVSESWTKMAKEYWAKAGLAEKIDLHLRPAVETLDELIERGEKDSFDFGFIDADKDNYDAYYERCLQLLRPGGVIGIDNVLWGGRTADPSVSDADTTALRNLNAKIREDTRVESTMLPIGDGLTLVRKL